MIPNLPKAFKFSKVWILIESEQCMHGAENNSSVSHWMEENYKTNYERLKKKRSLIDNESKLCKIRSKGREFLLV